MTEDQKEFWQVVIMHLMIAGFVAVNAVPYLRDVPLWLIIFATVVGVTGGILKASYAQMLHRTHRPSLVRGLFEGVTILLVIYAGLRQLEILAPNIRELAFVAVLLAVPAWVTAYAVYMLVDAFGGEDRQASRF